MPLLKVSAGKATGGSLKVKRWRHGNVTGEYLPDVVTTGPDGPEYAANARRQTAINGRRCFYQSRLYALRGKTLLACLICYTFYSGVDWEGIHTCMLTCVIVANPNVGSSYQKMVLRFGGAFCGAILALLFTLLVMPRWTILSNCCLCWHRFSCWAHGLPPALNALLISAHRWWSPSRSPRSKTFWPGVRHGGNSRSRHGYHHWYRGVRGDLHLCLA